MSKQQWPAPIALAVPQSGDFCCMPVTGGLGAGIEAGEFLAETLQGVRGAKLQPYDHAEVYVGLPDKAGPYGYTCSAYPNNGTGGVTGKRALPYPAAELPGSLWSSGIIVLTQAQRAGVIGWCLSHSSVAYSWPDYGAIALHAMHVPAPGLKAYIASTSSMICSQYTDAAYAANGVHLFSDGRWPGYVSPGDLAVMLQAKMAALKGGPGVLPGMAGSGGSNRALSLEETAGRIGCAQSTLYKHWREWAGLHGYKVGNLVRFRERNVESYIDQLEQRTGHAAVGAGAGR